jgi:Ca2+-binding EF-hand superfamily protein
MGNSLTRSSLSKLNKIAIAEVTNGFFGDFVVEWSLARLHLCRERYMDSFLLTPLTRVDLQYILPSLHGSTRTDLLFDTFAKACGTYKSNGHSKNTCDGLGVLGGIAMDCRAILVDRLKFSFIMYDFDNSHTLNLAELTMMVRTTLGGMAALAGVPCPAIEDLHRVAKDIFEHADTNHDGSITLDEFVAWSTSNRHAVAFFSKHQETLNEQIEKIKSDPNDKGSVQLSAFEDAEAQLLKSNSKTLDLKQHYLGDQGLSDLIEDLRSHARHATASILSISLQGNGISSTGAKEMVGLLNDASADRFGALGHYLGRVKHLDFSNNSRIESDFGPHLLKIVKTSAHLETLVLTGTSISKKMKRQIIMIIQDKADKNKGIKEAKADVNAKSSEGRAPTQTKNGGTKSATTVGNGYQMTFIPSLLKQHHKWKDNVKNSMQRRDEERLRAKQLLDDLKDLKVANLKNQKPSQKKHSKILWQEFTKEGVGVYTLFCVLCLLFLFNVVFISPLKSFAHLFRCLCLVTVLPFAFTGYQNVHRRITTQA